MECTAIPVPPWQLLIEQLTKELQRLESENALLRGQSTLDKAIADVMADSPMPALAKLGPAPVEKGSLAKPNFEISRELSQLSLPALPALPGENSEPPSSRTSRASPRSDAPPVSASLRSPGPESIQRQLSLQERTTVREFSIMKVQTVNASTPSAVKPWYVINPARCCLAGPWQIIVFFSLVFVALVTPVQVCLLHQNEYNPAFFLGLLVDFIFLVDMGLQFCTAYTRNTPSGVVLEVRLGRIVSRYLKTWFFLDFVTLIPFDLIAPHETDNDIGYSGVKVLRALRLLKLIRLARRSPWMEEQEALRSIPYQQLALARFLLVLGLMCHWLACLWAFTLQLVDNGYPKWIDEIQESDLQFGVDTRESPYRIYVASFFFCAYTVTSVGYGDISPQNILERIVGSVIVLISGLAWAYIIGEVGAIVDDLTHESQEFRQRMHRLNTMMGDQGLEPDLQCRLRRYFLQNRHQSVFKERQALMERMSPQLRAEACIAINGVWLQKVPFFKQFISHIKRLECEDRYTGPEEACVADISKKLQLQAFAQEESFDNLQVLFILSRGMLAVFCHKSHLFVGDRTRTYGFKGPGEVWGEDFVLSDVSLIRSQTGYALTYCEVLSLTHHDFMQVLQRRRQSCPELWAIVRHYTIWLAVRRGIFAEAKRRIWKKQKKESRAARNSTSTTKSTTGTTLRSTGQPLAVAIRAPEVALPGLVSDKSDRSRLTEAS